jgi:tRNA-dihydrouridine synthase
VINKLRALMSWYSKGLDGGSHLRIRVNAAGSIAELRDIIHDFFVVAETVGHDRRHAAPHEAAPAPA